MLSKHNGMGVDLLDATRASILGAYYSLRVEYEADQIGTREIAKYLKRQWPARDVPSESVIQRTMVAAGLPHRGPGKPSLSSRAASGHEGDDAEPTAPPFLPIRREPPRSRGPR